MITTAICANKGGVGKTTATVNLAAAFAELGHTCCIVDLDPQANATVWFGRDPYSDKHVGSLLFGEVDAVHVIVHLRPKLYLIPSSHNLTAYDNELNNKMNREGLLRKVLRKLTPKFDYVFIDCPPELKFLAANALVASQAYLIPMQTEIFSWKGVNRVVEWVEMIQEDLNPDLVLAGIFLNQYHPNRPGTQSKEILSAMRETELGQKLLSAYIRQDAALKRCIEQDEDIFRYDPASRGAEDFKKLANELLTLSPYKNGK